MSTPQTVRDESRQEVESTRSTMPSARQALLGMLAGFAVGVIAFQWPNATLDRVILLIEPLGAIWLAALQMLVLPLMVSMVICAIGRADSGAAAGQMGISALLWSIGLLIVAAALTMLLGNLVLSSLPLDDASRAAFQRAAGRATTSVAPAAPSMRDMIVNLVPTNLFKSAAAGDLLPLIVAAFLFGGALRSVPDPRRTLLLDVVQGVADWCFALAALLFRLLPLAVFALVLVSTAQSGAGLASGLLYYVALVSAFLVAGTLLLYPTTVWLGRVPLARFAAGLWPVQLLALSTRSSVACLPAMLACARQRLLLPDAVSGFTLPFAVSTFKLNMAISANLQLLFLLHVYGLRPDPVALLVAVVTLTMQSFATPGLPSGAIWTTTPIYLAMGIPLDGIVLTNVVDTIPDLFKTVANVSADLSLTALVARRYSAEPAAA